MAPRVRRRTARQRELLDRLVDLMAAEGFSGFTLDDLAERLHCSKSTLYALAGSKQELVVEVAKQFFRTSSLRVEDAVGGIEDPTDWIATYLQAVGECLKPMSPAFMEDLAAFPPADEVYRRNTAIAAGRIRDKVVEGMAGGAFRQVHAALAAELVAVAMGEIQRGTLSERLGLTHAEAYAELAGLVVHGLAE